MTYQTQFPTEARNVLDHIIDAFDGLSEINKLLLLDALGSRTEQCDEIGSGLEAAALAYGRAHSSLDDEGDEAEAIADSIIPQGKVPREVWVKHTEKADRTLRHAFAWKYGKVAA